MPFKIKHYQDKFVDSTFNRSLRELEEFFHFKFAKGQKPALFIIDSRREINLVADERMPSWFVGWSTPGNNVYLLNRRKFSSESAHHYTADYYQSLLKHELTHTFCSALANNSANPAWFWEGIADYVSCGYLDYPTPAKFSTFLRYYDKLEDAKGHVYEESGYAIKLLVDQYGKQKLIRLIKTCSDLTDRTSFAVSFKKIYHFELTYSNFNRLLEK